jgi:chromosomal replication initiation ATPase DnaA
MTSGATAMPLPGARQLALDLGHAESFARTDFFVTASNAAALETIEQWPDWPAPVLALVGPEGSGRSHLAAIWAAASGARFLSARALQLASLPAALATGALVLEDMAPGFDERALFHLLNLAREHEAFVLLTATASPATWMVSIADLASRLRSVPTAAIGAPDDALLRAVMFKLFADRQLQVDETLIAFLLPRIERSLTAARAAVALLDESALRQGRAVNRTLAAELFREQYDLFREVD